jgi:2-polyprenyl-3-methyl-5-hydroxy-6-metoxy-1,4-benzoquinol methylase
VVPSPENQLAAQAERPSEYKPPELTRLSEKILMSLCRDPKAPDYPGGTTSTTVDNALDYLCLTVPDFRGYFKGRKVLDFGCGWGNQAVAMFKNGASEVVGLDIQWHDRSRKLAAEHKCADRVRFVERLDPADIGTFDMVLSCSAMEHYADPAAVVETMKRAAKPGGVVIISFAEPWYGPRGSHFSGYSHLPWVNVLFSERTIMRVRGHFRTDGAQRFEEVAGGLNRMTIAKFERIIGQSGMKPEYFRVFVAKGVPLAHRVPVLRELLASAAACVLRKPA